MNSLNLLTQTPSTFDLENLLEPVGLSTFLEQYWENEPLILHREQADYYQSLFSIENVDQVLDLHRPTGNSIRVVKNQVPLLPGKYENGDGSLNLNQLYAAYADGYTVVINEIDRFWRPLKDLCRRMSAQLSHRTVANMYLTPQTQNALLPHYDTHDVFVIQVHGKKHWKIYDSPMESPLLHSFQPIFQREQLRGQKDLTLCAGDIMYMPRGVPHEAFTTDESSLHITIGVHPAQWVDLFAHAFKQMALTKVALRKALPVGYLRPENWTPDFIGEMQNHFSALLQELSDQADIQGGIQLLFEEFRGQQLVAGDGHFAEVDQTSELSLDTLVEKRQNQMCMVQNMGGAARISFPGNTIKGPAHIAGSLQFVATTEGPFTVSEIPGLSDRNKIQLVARLIRGGLLKTSRSS